MDVVSFAERFGWLGAVIFFVVYEIVVKWVPKWQSDKTIGDMADRAALIAVYERFISQNEKTVLFIQEMTTVVRGVGGQLDGNTAALTAIRLILDRLEYSDKVRKEKEESA